MTTSCNANGSLVGYRFMSLTFYGLTLLILIVVIIEAQWCFTIISRPR